MNDLLNNPVWHALETKQSQMAVSHGGASHYPSCVSPFAAVLHVVIDSPSEHVAVALDKRIGFRIRRSMAYTLLECTHD